MDLKVIPEDLLLSNEPTTTLIAMHPYVKLFEPVRRVVTIDLTRLLSCYLEKSQALAHTLSNFSTRFKKPFFCSTKSGGEDLQERKKILVEGADALLVLPGGPGTWDEVCHF